MDLDATDARTLDVSRRVARVALCYYSDDELRALSVREIVHSAAFDAVGRPSPAGLYAPALGPTSYTSGACVTCGLTYQKCPGHFGHIALPVPLVHPHLADTLFRILRAACWHCGQLRTPRRKKSLILARLRFEHAGLRDCSAFVRAYRWSVLESSDNRGRSTPGVSSDEHAVSKSLGAKAVLKAVQAAPALVHRAFAGLDLQDERSLDTAIYLLASEEWEKACANATLADSPGGGWTEDLDELFRRDGVGKCPNCMEKNLKIMRGEGGTFFFGTRRNPTVMLGPMQLQDQMKRVWGKEKDLFDLVFGLKGRSVRRGQHPLDYRMFFVRTVLVPPSRFRPVGALGEIGTATEHPQNIFYQRLLTSIETLVDLEKDAKEKEAGNGQGYTWPEKEGSNADSSEAAKSAKKITIARTLADMQRNLLELYDSPGGDISRNGGAMGIRQQLESKQGLFRMHMMGKRVNFSCRSVIGPDVFLDTNEVGIPESFAKLLTVAEPVTSLNLAEMRAAVLNGPDVYPGANAVEDWTRNGALQVIKLKPNKQQLETQSKLLVRHAKGDADPASGGAPPGVALPKRVLRHLRTGDLVLFNRQPTLHRVSMMAHRVRVLPGDRTIRFHYANCRSYNADFDGDEMNVHVLQDPIARAEAVELMLSDRHYVVPTSGAPVRDLIQDHILAAALITNRDMFFSRGAFCDLLYAASERIMSGAHQSSATRFSLPVPAILKPQTLWTGKQLISAVLGAVRGKRPGLSLERRSRVKADLVGSEEASVLFKNGELLRGVLDKNAFGASMFGVVHAVQEAYGSSAAGAFLSAIGRLCTLFLRRHGHTTGVDDLLLVDDAEKVRASALRNGVACIGYDAAKSVHRSFSGNHQETSKRNGEAMSPRSVSPVSKSDKRYAEGRDMVESLVRAKGDVAEARIDSAINSALNALASTVNKCIPGGLVKKFPRNGFSLMTDTGAKGSAVNSRQISCLLGSTIMEGKRVPRMGGSGATLPCFAPYDPSPNAGGFIASRFLTGIAPYEMFFHAMAGREGLLDTSLKTANSGYLQRCLIKHLEGVRVHYDYTTRDSDGSVLQMIYGDDGIDPCKSSWLVKQPQWQLQNREALGAQPDRESALVRVSDTADDISTSAFAKSLQAKKPSKDVRALRKRLRNTEGRPSSTLLELASPGALAKFGVVSESFESLLKKALSGTHHHHKRVSAEAFLMERYRQAAIEPGDGVGVIAAHSVGEPSTQMTLNTFHHAGSESKHVTLGVPRLRELLMTASKYPKTPSMTLPLLQGQGREGAQEISRRFANVALVDLLERVVIKEGGVSYAPELGDAAVHNYSIVLLFPEEQLYKEQVGFDFGRILDTVNKKFLYQFTRGVARELKKTSVLTVKKRRSPADDDEPPGTSGDPQTEEAVAEADPHTVDAPSATETQALQDGVASDDDGEDEGRDGSDMDDYGQENEGEGEEIADRGNASGNDESGEEEEEDRMDVPRGPSAPVSEDMQERIRAWKEAKLKEMQASKEKKAGKAAVKKTGKSKADIGKTQVPLADSNTESAVGMSQEVEDNMANLGGSVGLAGEITTSEDRRRITLPWVLPHEATGRLRLAQLVEEAASAVKLASVERITKCFNEEVMVAGSKRAAVATEGSNILAVIELGDGIVDLDNITSNDMYGILSCYGVEALRSALVEEFKKIFDAYGISVNLRHLSLIADYMTAHGGYRGFNRGAMIGVPSLFQQFSFETTMKFMTDAALKGKEDKVQVAPSTSIATGELYSGGTGSFELLSEL